MSQYFSTEEMCGLKKSERCGYVPNLAHANDSD